MNDAWNAGSSRRWADGDWSMDLRDDEFAEISYRGRVVLRSIQAIVRDRNWDTAPVLIDRVDESEHAIVLHVRTDGLGADLRGTVRAEIHGDRFTVSTDLESYDEFWTNRTGLVVLHPPALSGAALTIHHTDGSTRRGRFPEDISPHQPAFEIAGLGWSDTGLDVDVRFAGDVFEMEDQRNWTDASYKTYSRPLARPFPYRLDAGARVVQSIEISVSGTSALPSAAQATSIRLEPGPALPSIATSAGTGPDPAPVAALPTGITEIIVELDLAAHNWPNALRRAASAGLPLDVRFVVAEEHRSRIQDAVRALAGLPVARVSAFWSTGDAPHISDISATTMLRRAVDAAGITAEVVGGTRSHFTELNRERHRLPDDLDALVFSVTPLFHSNSTAQLVESVAMQRLVADQAAKIAGDRPVHIGPISLRPHFNNVAPIPRLPHQHHDLRLGYGPALIDAADPRQAAPQLAAWTIASAAALAVPGVATLAFFEEWGPRGLIDASGVPHPVREAITELASMSSTTRAAGLRAPSPDGLIWAIGTRDHAGADTILVANLDRCPRRVTISVADGGSRTIELPAGAYSRI